MIKELVALLLGYIIFSLSAITGGGASIVLSPLLSIYYPLYMVPFVLTLSSSVSSISRLITLSSSVKWKIVKQFVPFSFLGAIVGAYVLSNINILYLQYAIGLYLIANIKEFFNKKKVASNLNINVRLIGLVAGFISALSGAVGLLFNKFYLNLQLDQKEIIATRAANELLLHVFKLIIYCLLLENITNKLSISFAISLGAFLAGLSSLKLLHYIKYSFFKSVNIISMVGAGSMILFQAVTTTIENSNIGISMRSNPNKYETTVSWNKSDQVVLEFNWKEGIEYEVAISRSELPASLLPEFQKISEGKEVYLIEKVYSLSSISYEIYFRDGEKIGKEELKEVSSS